MKPILFNTEMVRAILESRKTVTRRVVKGNTEGLYIGRCALGVGLFSKETDLRVIEPPYKVGDILWVRETWGNYGDGTQLMYKADYPDGATIYIHDDRVHTCDLPKWRPSIHMPKEAARLFLKVTHISVERLCGMQLSDFIAEGITLSRSELKDQNTALLTAKARFKELWNSTSGKRGTPEYYVHSWYGNPYVWVIEFEVISKSEALGGSSPEG